MLSSARCAFSKNVCQNKGMKWFRTLIDGTIHSIWVCQDHYDTLEKNHTPLTATTERQ